MSGTNGYPTLDKSLIITPPGSVRGNATFIVGGLGNVKGLRLAGVSAGFRKNPNRRDFALVVAEQPAVASGLFTTNRFAAAPVLVSRAHLGESAVSDALSPPTGQGVKAIIINSGQANASTGLPGHLLAISSAELVAEALGCEAHQVLVASTGVIGRQVSIEQFKVGIAKSMPELGLADGSDVASGLNAAEAIMTTDTYAKQAAVTVALPDGQGGEQTVSIAGMVKGSGMIEPNMATMLGVFATDARLSQAAADTAFRQAINLSLNKLTVDSDTSTNDSAYFLATGAAYSGLIELGDAALEAFTQALTTLCVELARQLAADGEGATKLVTVKVYGAIDDAQADLAARAVANSPLVKTAIAGHDANWGRIAAALGKSGAVFEQEQVNISLLGLPVLKAGLPIDFDEEEALRLFRDLPEVIIEADLGTGGGGQATIWTCDLTHGYISINGDYRS
jgi:glutamate N-acetyltransferase/amino-acid N-acetyltransferase